jgi:hypothetical protein
MKTCRRVAPALVAAALVACSTSGTSPYPERVDMPSLKEPYLLPTEVCGDFFVVDVHINGAGPWSFLLDTGAGRTMVDPDVLREAKVVGRLDSLRIGDFSAFRLGYGRLDMDELSAALGRRVDGILGHPVFGGTLVTYDYPAREVVLEVGELPADDTLVVPTRADIRPFVRSEVGGTRRWILIDTGSSRGLTLREPRMLPWESPMEATGARVRVDGVHVVLSGRLEGEARIGLMRVDRPVVSNSVSVDLVGQEVLRHYRLTFDQRNDRLRIERPDTVLHAAVESPAVRTSGYAIRPHADHAEVIHTWDPAVPVEEGDRILSVAGRAWSDRSCSVSRVGPLPDPVPDTVDLRLVRGGDTLTVQAPRRVVHPRGSR